MDLAQGAEQGLGNGKRRKTLQVCKTALTSKFVVFLSLVLKSVMVLVVVLVVVVSLVAFFMSSSVWKFSVILNPVAASQHRSPR